ncbi:unnamed protein product [Caenorhabditis brenneri]
MTEFLKNNPIVLRHCMLYAYLQHRYIYYYEFRNVIGKDVIDEKELRFWCSRFDQGRFDDNEKPLDNIVDILRNSKHALRACVMYESLRSQKPENYNESFCMYKSFVSVVGRSVMEYREFDFWFYRFLNREYDLNFERNNDKKVYELMDMPIDIMKYILEYLDIFDRTKLAKTSRSLHTFVEDQKLFHHTLKLVLDNNSVAISFGASASILYTGNHESCIKSFGNKLKIFNGVSLWEKGLMDHYSIVEIPKLHLDTFSIDCSLYPFRGHNPLMYDEISEESNDSDEFADYLNVKTLNLKVRFWHLLLTLLPSLKPGYLTTIDIDIDSYEPDEDVMGEVVEMEQWKQAKCLSMTSDFFRGPLHHLYHFKEFSIIYRQLSVMDVREMKEILFKSPEFEKCTIGISFENPIDVDAIRKEFGDAVQVVPPTTNLRNVFRNDKHALRACVMYEALRYQKPFKYNWQFKFLRNRQFLFNPSFFMYKQFCKVVGKDLMEYREFDFLYYRFLNEEFDLNIERDEDNKIYELIDMPIDVMKNVVEYLDIFDRTNLAKTSRSLQTFVKDQKLFHNELEFLLYDSFAQIKFGGGKEIRYEKRGNDCHRQFRREKLIENVCHWKHALQNFGRLLKYPKLHLNSLEIHFELNYRPSYYLVPYDSDSETVIEEIDELDKVLKSTHQLPVKKLTLKSYTLELLKRTLPTLKPGYLTTIVNNIYSDESEQALFEDVFEMEQWKQTKYFTMKFALFVSPLRHLYHFKEFSIVCRGLSVEDVREMKEILFKSPDFERCDLTLRGDFDTTVVGQVFGDATQGRFGRLVYRHAIPNSNEMSEFLKNNPLALRHCLLFEFLQSNSVEQAFTGFRDLAGSRVIENEDIQFWFNQFKQGKFDDNHGPTTNLRNVLRDDKHALRAFTWQLDRLRNPAFCSNAPFLMYEIFCKVIGNDVMKYREYDFWFYRFVNREFDLNYERDKDMKTYELTDLPIDVMKNFMQYLDIFDRINLARTSQSLHAFVEDQKLFHAALELQLDDRGAQIKFNCYENKKYYEGFGGDIASRWKQAFRDFESFLKYPKLHLYNLEIHHELGSRALDYPELEAENVARRNQELEAALKSIHQLPIKKLTLKSYTLNLLLKTLPIAKPGYLTTIEIDIDSDELEEAMMEEVTEMEQWKQAKYLKQSFLSFAGPLRYMYHFKQCEISYSDLSVEDVHSLQVTWVRKVLFAS